MDTEQLENADHSGDWDDAHTLIHQVLDLTRIETDQGPTLDVGKAIFLLNVALLGVAEEGKRSGILTDQLFPVVSNITGDKILVTTTFETIDTKFADIADTYRAQDLLEKSLTKRRKRKKKL